MWDLQNVSMKVKEWRKMMKHYKVGFPRVGVEPSRVLREFIDDLGIESVPPPPVTSKTIELGVKNSPEMICHPYKVTLGSMIEVAEKGADIIVQFSAGKDTYCRQKQFWRLQASCLAEMGYQCTVLPITASNLVSTFVELSRRPKWYVTKRAVLKLGQLRLRQPTFKLASGVPNIGIIGEVYTCVEEAVNGNLLDLIERFGGNPVRTVLLEDYVKTQSLWKRLGFGKTKYDREAAALFEGQFAGHAEHNVASLFRLIEMGVNGVVHVLPLTCMPETTIEDYVYRICRNAQVSLLRLPIDETNSPANIETRVETFVKLICRKYERKRGER